MSIAENIEEKLREELAPIYIELINESDKHNVPEGSESHFKLILVSSAFEAQKLIQRHRRVNGILREELANNIHALSMHTYTEVEWRKKYGDVPESPPCLGGS